MRTKSFDFISSRHTYESYTAFGKTTSASEGAKHLFCKHCIREWTKRYGDWAPLERS